MTPWEVSNRHGVKILLKLAKVVPGRDGRGRLTNRIADLNSRFGPDRRTKSIRLVSGSSVSVPLSDSIGQWLWYFGEYSDPEARIASVILNEGGTLVDVGAHVGVFSLAVLDYCDVEPSVLAFEPAPDTLRFLTHNVRINRRMDSVRVIDWALSDRPGQSTILVEREGDLGSRHIAPISSSGEITVESFDRLCEAGEVEISDPWVLKIDVEGAEALVIKGMATTLSNQPPDLAIIELIPENLARFGATPEIVVKLLDTYGLVQECSIGINAIFRRAR